MCRMWSVQWKKKTSCLKTYVGMHIAARQETLFLSRGETKSGKQPECKALRSLSDTLPERTTVTGAKF